MFEVQDSSLRQRISDEFMTAMREQRSGPSQRLPELLQRQKDAIGTERDFAALQQLGRFWSEADIFANG